jgi:hypothetical protein
VRRRAAAVPANKPAGLLWLCMGWDHLSRTSRILRARRRCFLSAAVLKHLSSCSPHPDTITHSAYLQDKQDNITSPACEEEVFYDQLLSCAAFDPAVDLLSAAAALPFQDKHANITSPAFEEEVFYYQLLCLTLLLSLFVLLPLQDKQDNITSPACEEEVFYYQLMEVTDFRNDVILAEACRGDVDKYCKDVEPGARKTLLCCALLVTLCGCRLGGCFYVECVYMGEGCTHVCSGDVDKYCKDVEPGALRCAADYAAPAIRRCMFQVHALRARQLNTLSVGTHVCMLCCAVIRAPSARLLRVLSALAC